MTRRSALAVFAAGLCLALLTVAPPAAPAAEGMKPEELVRRHLESIGPEAARAAAKTRAVFGVASVAVRADRGTPETAQGKAVLASAEGKALFGMMFGITNYPQESIAYDGKNVTTSFISPGRRSPFAEFVLANNALMKGGLLGGALSSGWALGLAGEGAPKLSYGGLADRDGVKLHELRVTPRGTKMTVKFFFEPDTFRHVRSEYLLELAAGMGANPNDSAGQRGSRYKLTETFSDFRAESGLTLPHAYVLEYDLDYRGSHVNYKWSLALDTFRFNEPFDPKSFTIG